MHGHATLARMSEAPDPPKQVQWPYLVGMIVVAGLLWLADGRLWSSSPSPRALSNGLWIVLCSIIVAELLSSGWRRLSWLRRAIATGFCGVFLWRLCEVIATMVARGKGAVALAWLTAGLAVAMIVWGVSRLPEAWRRKATSVAAGGAYLAALALYVPGQAILAFVGGRIGLGELVGRLGLFVVGVAIVGAGFLAVTRLSGWTRNLACFAIVGLTWIVGGIGLLLDAGAASDIGAWMLTLAPPIIAGGVLAAYWRIDVTSRSAV